MSRKILVLGATGSIGKALVDALIRKGEVVKAASRAGRPFPGAEGVQFDITNPATFPKAFEDVDRAYVMLPSGYVQAKELLTSVIATAAATGVKVVLQSVFGVDADDSISYRQAEIALESSGTPFVILRPNWFADNFHTFWKAGVAKGILELPAGEGASSFIDIRDIAESAAAALTSDAFDGRSFNLTGPKALSYEDAAVLLSDVVGREITYRAVSDEEFIRSLTEKGVPGDYAAFLASIFYPVRQGWTSAVTDDVRLLTGKEPRSLETYARFNAAALRGG